MLPICSVTPLSLSILGTFLAAIFILYRAALPHPIPGISFKASHARQLLGSLPDLLEHGRRNGDQFRYMGHLMHELDSPIVQFFARPFGKPWVLVADHREARDVLTRRTREFDRSKFFGDVTRSLIPDHQVHMPTGPEWTAHRRLMNATMSNTFLQNTVGPKLETTVRSLVDLWTERARLAEGRPFDARDDVNKEALEAMWTVTFGSDSGSMQPRLDLLKEMKEIALPCNTDSPLMFPDVEDTESFTSMLALSKSPQIAVKSAFPLLAHRFALSFYPSLVSARRLKDAYIYRRLTKARATFSQASAVPGMETGDQIRSAIDLIVQQEVTMAEKEERPASIYTPTIQDELFGFLWAGHETTAVTMMWALKHLSAHQAVQSQLRNVLRSHFNSNGPSAKALAHTTIPYLDSVIAETLRISTVSSSIVRVALVDTHILGHAIPKGTDVFFLNNGPGYLSPALEVDDTKRSASSLEAKENLPAWNEDGIDAFDPSRWIERDGAGRESFNPRAGPSIPYGGGPRSCFGQKLANMSLRVHVAYIVGNFELQPVPDTLSSMGAVYGITRAPEACYIRLKAL